MNTIELARHVADNPDGCDISDLKAFMEFVGQGDTLSMLEKSADLWPDENSENRGQVLNMLRLYCRRSIIARELRGSGNIQKAMTYEKANDQLHSDLPEWARW